MVQGAKPKGKSMKKALLSGLGASSSIALGYFPVAVSFGVAAVQAGLSPWFATLISIGVYAGASQFILIVLIAQQTAILQMVMITIAVNLRHLFYGPALLSQFQQKELPRWPALMAFGLTDEVFVTARGRLSRIPPGQKEAWYLGLQLGAYSAWVSGTVLGAYVASDWLMEQPLLQQTLAFVLPALFFALLLDMKQYVSGYLLLSVATTTLCAHYYLPAHHSLLIGMGIGGIWAWLQQKGKSGY